MIRDSHLSFLLTNEEEIIMRDIFHNLTNDQIDLTKEECARIHTELIEALKKDPENTQLQIKVCGWEQFCENIGCPGYET
jgi:hypothetical protein